LRRNTSGDIATPRASKTEQQMPDSSLKVLTVGAPESARTIAVRVREGDGPGLFWLGGFKSDMQGTKAAALDQWAAAHGRACIRFDYSGHGESGGEFRDGTIGRWLEESVAVFEAHARGPQVLVGSSMGGWLALLLGRALAQRQRTGGGTVAGMVLIAPAVDFTEELMWKRFPAAIRREIETTGVWMRPSDYSAEPYPITRQLIEEGRVQDPDVPWDHAVELVSHIARDDVVLTLVKDGDHRLSRPEDIERLTAAVAEFQT
jgi:pimeloyl-ACP methyl ester carboxylesterase